MQNNNSSIQLEQRLKKVIFSEPSSHKTRPQMVGYLNILYQKIKRLNKTQLLGSEGHAIAMDITGALAFQGAKGVKGEDWVTAEKEPLLYDILNTAAILDIDPNNSEIWDRLSSLLGELEE